MKIEKRSLYVILEIIQIFIAVGAIPAGLAMLVDPSGAKIGMPIEMLSNSPFSNFLIPGLFLISFIGLGSFIGGIITIKRMKLTGLFAIGLGTSLIIWLLAQFYWIGFHWLQAVYFVLGTVEFILGLQIRMHRLIISGVRGE